MIAEPAEPGRVAASPGWWVAAALGLYGALMGVAVGAVLDPLERLARWRRRARPDDLAERQGRASAPAATGGGRRILLHAVSVGEMRAAAALAHALESVQPGVELIVTAGNRDGRAAAERLLSGCPAARAVQLLPWDRPAAMRAWLARLRPDAAAVVEAEIWPGLFGACRQLGIPLAVVSGRLTGANVRGYRLARPIFARVLAGAAWIGVQEPLDRQRFLAIGAPPGAVYVLGDLKAGAPAAPASLAAPAAFGGPWIAGSIAAPRPLLVAGSTHAPEERWLIAALERLVRPEQRPRQAAAISLPRCADEPRALQDQLRLDLAPRCADEPQALRALRDRPRLVLAPRSIGRAAAVARLARRRGLRCQMWSEQPGGDDWDVLVLDRLGPLAALYPGAALAFVGGTLARRGGHTPLEAAACGVPLLAGPHRQHIAAVAARLERAGGLQTVGNARQLAAAWQSLLADLPRRRRMRSALLTATRDGCDVAARYARALLAGGPGIADTAAAAPPAGAANAAASSRRP